jgi:hypothetical protein
VVSFENEESSLLDRDDIWSNEPCRKRSRSIETNGNRRRLNPHSNWNFFFRQN